ncbi:SLAP domain-containing protein [Lactobacillus xylocopicola]|uniref:Surface layer protein n=1 Tax=Lactobacillus xylocopicola TaxID=2976676 RepID=A0ABM8BIG7_9LACO|nr:SLAP domain-containing protein [Lactobacillus xylocopicola]BDR61102.1 hypothetical protein KIM322_13630 [Lactobacillus xylocopicola]
MKKNLRIASAAAAALMAVAPVAASTVSTVFADTTVTVVGGTTNTTTATIGLSLNITNVASLVNNDPASKVAASLATPTLPTGAGVSVSTAKIYPVGGVTVNATTGAATITGAPTEQLSTTGEYVAVATASITNLTPNKEYTIVVGGKNYKATTDATGIARVDVVSDSFKLFDTTKTGAPVVTTPIKQADNTLLTTVVSSGDVTAAADTVNAIATAITDKYTPTTTDAGTNSPNAATAKFTNLYQDIRDSLKAAGVTVKSDDTFVKPATPFKVTLNLQASNGKTGTFVVTVDPGVAQVSDSYPLITFIPGGTPTTVGGVTTVPGLGFKGTQTMKDNDALENAAWNYVPVNSAINKPALEAAFSAKVSNRLGAAAMKPTFDYSKVNTKVAGKYPVTVTATNADKLTSKLTFMLTVGTKGATYKTVQSNGAVPVYQITGNTVTDSKTTVQNGDQIATFGEPVIINGKSYTHINSADSDLYIETQYIDGTFKPADKVSKTVMHNAFIYDAKKKRVGTKMLAAFTKVDVLGQPTKLEDGSLVYKLAEGEDQYVMADNIDGTSRVLNHNAYVYSTSKKRADKRVLRKGNTVTTYGSPYTFKNGKAYYRIGGPSKQYIKVANVR